MKIITYTSLEGLQNGRLTTMNNLQTSEKNCIVTVSQILDTKHSHSFRIFHNKMCIEFHTYTLPDYTKHIDKLSNSMTATFDTFKNKSHE